MSTPDPTSPAGMTTQALAAELINEHGWQRTKALGLSHAKRIDAVVQERLNADASAERAQNAAVDAKVNELRKQDINAIEQETVAAFEEAEAEDDFSDLDDLLAEVEDKPNVQDVLAEMDGKPWGEVEEALTDAGLDPMDDRLFTEAEPEAADDSDLDPDELMAELVAIKDAEDEYIREHGLLISSTETNDYIFDNHAGAGPSASERWMSCTASLKASREFLETLTPNQQAIYANSNEAARQGTTAHAAAEVEARVMLGEMTQDVADLTLVELSLMPDSDGEAYTDEMGEYITEYTDLVKSYAQDRGNENILIEARVSAAVPLTGDHTGEVYEIGGSADFGALPTKEDPTLVVGDLKYGNGIWVGVDENSQAKIYALGMLSLLVDDEGRLPTWLVDIVLHIIQPRMDGIKTATITVESLLTWRDEVLAPALTAALYGPAEFKPSEGACQFCPARGACPALAEDRLISAASLFDTIVEAEYENGPGSFPETSLLSDTRLGELYSQISGLTSIFKDLKEEAERRLYRGGTVPGLVLVNYQPPRKWKEGVDYESLVEVIGEDTAADLLKEPALVSPTAAEKILKDAYASVEDWVDKPEKKPVVAKEGDRRKVWEARPPEAMFDVEGDE